MDTSRYSRYYPLLLNDIYLSEEYYGENVLHMAAVAEDPSIVKWLLDIGSDFHRRCYGNFFTCDDQKGSRRDNKTYEVPCIICRKILPTVRYFRRRTSAW